MFFKINMLPTGSFDELHVQGKFQLCNVLFITIVLYLARSSIKLKILNML